MRSLAGGKVQGGGGFNDSSVGGYSWRHGPIAALVYWFTEGLTDYYALRILRESGFWKQRLYAKWINRHIREYFHNPAIGATNDQIRKEFWSRSMPSGCP